MAYSFRLLNEHCQINIDIRVIITSFLVKEHLLLRPSAYQTATERVSIVE